MSPLSAYSPDYAIARTRFRQMLAERGWGHEAYPVSAAGFAEGDLSIDVGRIGRADAERLLILSSGIHGGEGVFGSAVQLAWLDSLPHDWQPPANCAILLLHALNPYGFACLRRANEENVDLNRNFLSPEQFAVLRESTRQAFRPFDPYLNPVGPPGPINWFPILFPWMALRYGMTALHQVMPAGQYAFPKGIFYGGSEQCRSTRVIMNEMPRWVGQARFILHLDYHTGLGKYGTYRLLASDPAGSDRVSLAIRMFGSDRVKADHETEGGYHNHGDMGEWLSQRFGDRDYLYLCAEFGTYDTTRVIGSLRRENQAHHWGNAASRRYAFIKKWSLDTFTPTATKWRTSVIEQSQLLNQNALNKCAETSI